MDTVIVIWVGLLGLVVGSFLNVAIYRLPRRMRFVTGRSQCPDCGTQLKWYHNVPLVSYLALGGRCAFCSNRISLRYPLVELLNGVFYVYFFRELGFSFQFVAHAFLASALIVVFLIDLEHRLIPDSVTLPGMAVALVLSLSSDGIGIVAAAIGLFVGGGALYLLALLGDWLFKKESMGGGDIKMAAMLGAFLGWQKVLFVFIASAVIGLAVSLVLMLFSTKLRQERLVPFGPFLATAAMAAIFFGDQAIDFYLRHVVGLP